MAKKRSRKPTRSVRTTITVPADLKTRMDSVGGEVNWSALAAEAFARKLDELAAGSTRTASLEAMTARLRAGRRQVVDSAYQCGWRLGHEWALQRADLGHLVLLERLCRTMTDDGWLHMAAPEAGDSPGDELLRRLCPELYGDPYQREGFWSGAGALGVSVPDQLTFVRGFSEGALDAWLRVKDDVGSLGWWCPTLAKKRRS